MYVLSMMFNKSTTVLENIIIGLITFTLGVIVPSPKVDNKTGRLILW